jgi:hypothetical protein
MPTICCRNRGEWIADGLVLFSAVFLSAVLARPYADCWNDGSRLATVESLVDHHTWIIDASIFVKVPKADKVGTPLPYNPKDRALLEHGTCDKLLIDGHYYSDKSPVPALLMAGYYQVWQWATGWTAATHANRFCWAMTFASSGLAYVVAAWCISRLGRILDLSLLTRGILTASFALSTVALPYARQVNNHMMLLAVAAALALQVAGLCQERRDGQFDGRRFAALGALAGLGYTIDLGVGPVLLVTTAVLVFTIRQFSLRSLPPILCFALAALPWLVLHHALNYMIGGTFKPANANAEYFRWPGSPFAANNLTGSWIHPNLGSLLLYTASMIAGKKGFFGHNLPLVLLIPATIALLRRGQVRRELLWALACSYGTWFLYAATSNNSSGQCCSIRWFVPLLAPAYLVLALLLRDHPRYRVDLLLLSGWGLVLVVLMRNGPWLGGMVPLFWPIQVAALSSWLLYHWLGQRRWSTPHQVGIKQLPYLRGTPRRGNSPAVLEMGETSV